MSPIIIIGAPRSGTNMIRDLLVGLDGYGTWKCDEINYIWRRFNKEHPNDEFTKDMANEQVKGYIISEFQKIASASNCETVVEKTCANSLRVDFVNEIFPNARYLFLVRDGRDAVLSATQRWKAKLEYSYLLKKARYVPISDIPYYGNKYLSSRIYKLFSKVNRIGVWGPKIADIENYLSSYSLEEVCALQWKYCVDKSEESFGNIKKERVLKIHYESFVESPRTGVREIVDFLGASADNNRIEAITKNVSPRSIGKWRNNFDDEVLEKIESHIRHTLSRHGYV